MLPNTKDETTIADYTDALNQWSLLSESVPQRRSHQDDLSELLMSIKLRSFTFSSNKDKALHLAPLHKESDAWLSALPSKFVGTFLDNNTFRISTALRIGSNIWKKKHQCICGDIVSTDELFEKCRTEHNHTKCIEIRNNSIDKRITRNVSWRRKESYCRILRYAPSHLKRSSSKSGSVAKFAANYYENTVAWWNEITLSFHLL